MRELVVTDEAVRKAAEVILVAATGTDNLTPTAIKGYSPLARATLAAAAPHLRVTVDRQTLALLLADTVQTLDKDEEWIIADRVIALLRSSGEGGK